MNRWKTSPAATRAVAAPVCLALAAVAVGPTRSARADALAAAPSAATVNPQAGPMLISGPGGVGASSQVGPANNLTQDPAAGKGSKFDDTVKIGPANAQVDVLSTKQVNWIGKNYLAAYPMPGVNAVVAGESLRYNAMTSNDKVADANAAANKTATMQVGSGPITGPAKITTTSASAIQTTFFAPGGAAQAIGLAQTSATNAPMMKAESYYSVAAINDPLHYDFTSAGQSVTATIGGGFTLQATSPGEFATAYFELGTDLSTPGTDQTLAAFEISVNSTTTSLAGVSFTFDAFSSLIGFSDQTSFQNYIESFLTFNAATNTLSVTNPSNSILLYTLTTSGPDSDVEMTFNTGAIVGSVVPEPASVVMLGLGLVGAAGLGWARRGRSELSGQRDSGF